MQDSLLQRGSSGLHGGQCWYRWHPLTNQITGKSVPTNRRSVLFLILCGTSMSIMKIFEKTMRCLECLIIYFRDKTKWDFHLFLSICWKFLKSYQLSLTSNISVKTYSTSKVFQCPKCCLPALYLYLDILKFLCLGTALDCKGLLVLVVF